MNNFKKLRSQAKLTQEELAGLLKVERSTVAMWEIGRALPRADKLPSLAKILNCSIDEILKEKEL